MTQPAKTTHPQVWRGKTSNTVLLDGREVSPPTGWSFCPAEDPALTRRLKKTGICWILVHKRKNRLETLGLWTDSARIESIRRELTAERADSAYQKKLDSARKKREAEQEAYVIEFRQAQKAQSLVCMPFAITRHPIRPAVLSGMRAIPSGGI